MELGGSIYPRLSVFYMVIVYSCLAEEDEGQNKCDEEREPLTGVKDIKHHNHSFLWNYWLF